MKAVHVDQFLLYFKKYYKIKFILLVLYRCAIIHVYCPEQKEYTVKITKQHLCFDHEFFRNADPAGLG